MTGCSDTTGIEFRRFPFMVVLLALCLLSSNSPVRGQSLEQQLLAASPMTLAREAARQGDARRGAIVFYQAYMACTKCHSERASQQRLGPNLAKLDPKPSDEQLVDSVLRPSKVIKKGYEILTVATTSGRVIQGMLVERNDRGIVLRDAAKSFQRVTIAKNEIDEESPGKQSIMPAGQVNALASRQQFLDLIRYLIEIRDGGIDRARELQPPPALYATAPLPEYEKKIDHAGMIRSLDQKALKRGEAIYLRVCANCHGTHDRPGSLPTSLKFASGKFKSGSQPYTMYQTLTRGFGLMVPQAWMVPEQKYDVIHYIREKYLKPRNTSQYFSIDEKYLASLPRGDTRGPKPSKFQPWQEMDYGRNLIATYEIGDDGKNFAYKGNAVRLDPGPGGVSRGNAWTVFDFDTLRMAAAWTGKEFIDYNGINFNGRHGTHPHAGGAVHLANPTGPGWAKPGTDSFKDTRLVGRDGRRYGPLPRDWAQYRGMYYHGNDTIVEYTVGKTSVLECQTLLAGADHVFARQFEIGPRDQDMLLQVLHAPEITGQDIATVGLSREVRERLHQVIYCDSGLPGPATIPRSTGQLMHFGGRKFLQIDRADRFDMDAKDYTIHARVKTGKDGTIFCKTRREPKWAANGKSLFIRDGRLTFDIGWVGFVQSRSRVTDNLWHHVTMTYRAKNHQIKFYIDGVDAGGGQLRPKAPTPGQVLRIGFTSENFPDASYFRGDIRSVEIFQTALSAEEIARLVKLDVKPETPSLAKWNLSSAIGGTVVNQVSKSLAAKIIRKKGPASGDISVHGPVLAGLASSDNSSIDSFRWSNAEGNLRLRIPKGGQPLRFTLWVTRLEEMAQIQKRVAELVVSEPSRDLSALKQGGPDRWPQVVKTQVELGDDSGPFAVDTLTYPLVNPWLCRMRLTGHDFYADNDRAAVCDWDGNVWQVSGLAALDKKQKPGAKPELTWKRIASGLFQPLGLRIIDDVIHVTCRDQLCRLHDLNGDQAIDWFECINNDHQVTDHFHEFAMGLQTDAEGNFYYAKSARHALAALVPHHGTLLRISKDGSKTDILAKGFRAANGVCLNPDGTFIVTDQEGHWNPKNRINWVKPGGFYGNMYGYHDVTDSSDEAMEQPLCWITNAFDRSPAELLWVNSKKWGPLEGRLLNISYGYGKVFLVPHETVDGQVQGGMIELPIPQFPTGTIRGRFHPADGQLYLSGMFSWAGSRTAPGGFYRLRYTGKPAYLPVELKAKQQALELEFTGDLDPVEAVKVENFQVKAWDLQRTKNYGSKHFNERRLPVTKATLQGRHLTLEVPAIEPTWCMEVRYQLKTSAGKSFSGVIHNTIHNLGDKK